MSIVSLPTYQEFIDSLRTQEYPTNIYHLFIVYFKDDIMLDVGRTNQGVVARKLRMHLTKFNPITNILKLDHVVITSDAIRELEDYIAMEGISDDDYTSSM